MGGYFFWPLLLGGAGLALVGLYCYLYWAPVAYELAGDTLTVFFRACRKRFTGATGCQRIDQPLSMWTTMRVCGNGGVFAGCGLCYNRRWGLFHAYVTREKHPALVLVETSRGKVLISPRDPEAFVSEGGG
ncbi:MAG: PH domain-containing protein [Phycisphaeraceae bacterium]